MKKAISALLAILLVLLLTACGPKLDPDLLDSSKPPAVDTPAAAPAEDAPVEDAPAPIEPFPEEIPSPEADESAGEPAPEENLPMPQIGAENPVFAGGQVIGNYDEIVSYDLFQPEIRGLGSDEADAKLNDFYAQLVFDLTDYAYNTVYKTAQERHTGANVTGTFGVMPPKEEGTLRLGYVLAVRYGDQDEDQTFTRIDIFDRATGELLESETE